MPVSHRVVHALTLNELVFLKEYDPPEMGIINPERNPHYLPGEVGRTGSGRTPLGRAPQPALVIGQHCMSECV